MQKFLEASDRMNGKGSLLEGEIRPHFSSTSQTERTLFHSAANKVARLFANSWSFARRLCQLLVSWHAETSLIKSTKMDLSPTTKKLNLDVSTPKTTRTFQCLIWEKHLFSNSPERYSSLQSSHVKTQANEVEIQKEISSNLKGISYLCLLPFFPLQPSQTKRCQWIKMEHWRNQWSQISNPKLDYYQPN